MFGGHKQQKGGSSYSFSSSNVTIDNKHPVTERADSLSMSGSPPLQRPNFVEEEVVQEEETRPDVAYRSRAIQPGASRGGHGG